MPYRYALFVPRSARSLAWLGILIVFAFSFFALVGWMLNIMLFKSMGFQWIPMKVTTAICFALLAIELVFLQKKSQGPYKHPIVLQMPGILVSLVGLMTLIFYSITMITGKEISLGGTLFHTLLWAPATRMSLLTAILFLVNGIVLTLLVSGSRLTANIAHAVMAPAITAGYLVPVTYLLGVQGLHESLKVPVALNTGICFCALGIAVFCVRPDTWLMKAFTGDHAGGLMARRLLPGLVIIPLVIGWLRLYGERSGAFMSEVGVALVALAYTFCLLGLVWITARSVNKTDDRRRQAEEALHEEHDFVSAVLDTAGAIVVVLDRQGRITRFNRACELITGYTASEVLGRVFWEFLVPPQDLAGVKETWEALNAGHFPNRHENHWRAKDGTQRLIAWSNTALTDLAGELQHIISTGIDITEQRQAETSLRESEGRFKAIASNTPDHILVQDHELRYTAVINPQLGLTEQDMIGKTDSDFLSLEDADKITRIKKQVLETGLPVHVETSLISQKGEEEFFDGSYIPKRNVNGETEGLIGYFRNITERKRMEEELRRSEQRWATTLASIGDAVIATDVAGNITFINAVAEELTGWTLSEASLMPVAEVFKIINEQTRLAVDCPVARVLRERMIVGLTNHTILVRKDGTEIPIDDSGAPIRDAEGKTVGVVLVFRDITERKRIEGELRESEERYRNLFNSMEEGFCIIEMIFDAEGRPADYRFLKVNAAFERQTGLHDAEGKLMRDLAPDHEAHWFEIYGKIALTGEPLHFENEARALNRWYEVYAYRVGKPEDRQVAIVFNDISVRRKAEEELRKAHDSLELRVQERTAELEQAYETLQQEMGERKKTEEQLLQSQKMEALGTLTGGIAHDFNNILSAIIGFAEMAADDVPKEGITAHSLQRVLQASSRGRDLIKQMLTFSRKTEAEKKPLRLSSLINETMKLIRASIPTTISIRVNLKDESALILADLTQIQQVLMNLCTNAAYAMGEQGGVLDVELNEIILSDEKHDQMKPGSYLKLVVRDTGVGIPLEHMDKIFDPFFTTKQVGEGTGLGLSVVHGIVNQHDGHITVKSEPGKGAVFSLYFPKISEESSKDAVTDETVPGGQERILFIDDEELIMEMGQMVLERLGYEVVSATSSSEALSLFRNDPARFDLVITDQTMPEMTGVELAKAILAIRPDIPVILCTGFSHLVDAKSAEAAGIRDFAMKPMTKREIAKTIRKVLDE